MPKIVYHDSDMVEKTVEIGADPILIGRATECQLQTQDAMVSRRHARIIWDGGYYIEDLGSSNGVYVGNERIAQRTPIRPGDDIRCGSMILKLMPEVARPGTGRMAEIHAPPVAVAPPVAPPPMIAPPPMAAPPVVATAWDSMPPQPYNASPPYQPPPAYEAPPAEMPPPPPRGRTLAPPPFVPGNSGSPAASDEVHSERARRIQAEAAVLTAEQRAASAEQRAGTAEAKLNDAVERAREAEQRVQALDAERAQLLAQGGGGGGGGEVDKLKRKIDQLNSELRRMRGGAPPPTDEDSTNAAGIPSAAALSDVVAERDRLKQRVTDLTAEMERLASSGSPAAPAPAAVPDADAAMLKRKVEQLMAENRRLRGGQPVASAGAPADDGRVAELEQKLAKAEQERDDARRQVAEAISRPAPNPPATVEDLRPEVEKLKRKVEQLDAENRRLRQGAAPPAEDPRIADLTARLEKAEQELSAARRAPAAAKVDPGAADAANQLNDLLADLRGNLRAASDEIGVIASEGPADSVEALREALSGATEQLESARGQVKELKRSLGINS